MDNATKRYLAEALTGMASVHDKELPTAAIAIWAQSLDGYSRDDLAKAFNRHARRSKFMPKPSDIIAIIEGRDDESTQGVLAAAEHAFYVAIRAIGSVGRYNTPDFADSATSMAIELMGGWSSFCDMTDREEPFERKRFCELYARALKNGDGPGLLSGSADRRRIVSVASTGRTKQLTDGKSDDTRRHETDD